MRADLSSLTLISCCALIAVCNPPGRNKNTTLRRDVLERIASNPVTRQANVAVAVSSGVATVTGTVPEPARAGDVLATVAATPGVLDVIIDLRLDDEVIRRAVLEALRADPLVKDVPVSVRCAQGDITLTSTQTNSDQRSRMVRIAGTVQGVEHVIDDMR